MAVKAVKTTKAQGTVMPFFRLEPDGTETCFLVQTKMRLSERETEEMRERIRPYFKYLPTHVVTDDPNLTGQNVGIVGPRLEIETPDSSESVEILRSVSRSKIARVEVFRRLRIPGGKDEESYLASMRDRVLERSYTELPATLQGSTKVPPVITIPFQEQGIGAVKAYCEDEGLKFNDWHWRKIEQIFTELRKNPTDSAILQLAQVWSDHCWHIIFFLTRLTIDGQERPYTLIEAIKAPYDAIRGTEYDNMRIGLGDNASAITGYKVPLLVPIYPGGPSMHMMQEVTLHLHISAETHNWPEQEEPFHGATTEILGELRDGMGAGRGSLVLFAGCGRVLGSLKFSNGYQIPGEFVRGRQYEYRDDKASPMHILRRGLAGWHSAANEIGKPCLHGFFYSGAIWRPKRDEKRKIVFELLESQKPVGFGSAVGTIREEHADKREPKVGWKIVRIGGPPYPVGYCGGSGSSNISGTSKKGIDAKGVQRGNGMMERLVYQVFEACIAMGPDNPLEAVHDQGAGGIANLLTELMGKAGGKIYLASIERGDKSMSDAKVWICEYQEGMGMLVRPENILLLMKICRRCRCPFSVVGEITGDGRLLVYSEKNQAEVAAKKAEPIVDLPLPVILEKSHTFQREDNSPEIIRLPLVIPRDYTFERAAKKTTRRLEVGCKDFAIREVDTSVGALQVLNQFCGPFSTPINDCALSMISYDSDRGVASSFGVAPYATSLDPAAGVRLAIGEMFTNLLGVFIERFELIKCICNWMWPANLEEPEGEIARLDMAVVAVRDLLLELISAIFGGKDSSSMATWLHDQVIIKSIETVVFSSIAPVGNVRRHVTPDIKLPGESMLIHVDMADGNRRLGGSSFGQSLGQLGDYAPDLDDGPMFKRAFQVIQQLLAMSKFCAGHDISSGGLYTTVAEMCFAAGCGAELTTNSQHDVYREYLAEELGYVMEVPTRNSKDVLSALADQEIPHRLLGYTTEKPVVCISHNDKIELDCSTDELRREWERTSYQLRKEMVDPSCAEQERRNTRTRRKPIYRLTFEPKPTAPEILIRRPYKLAVIREKGSNGHPEVISAFYRSGFDVMDLHMSDLEDRKIRNLKQFQKIVFAPGFSNKDTLGAAMGWSRKIMDDPYLKDIFDQFFAREDTLSLGICNGAQLGLRCGWVLPDLPEDKRPLFTRIDLGSFNHQWIRLKVVQSPVVLLREMEGSILGAWVANGEGKLNCDNAPEILDRMIKEKLIPLVYVDALGRRTNALPHCPSGSFAAGVCDPTGRHLYAMPHFFDRAFDLRTWGYVPPEFEGLEAGPWEKMGQNAMEWLHAA